MADAEQRNRAPASSRLRKAVLAHNARRVRQELAAGGDPNEVRDGVTLFESALREERYDEVILALYDAGGDLGRVSPSVLNLVWAVGTGRADVVAAFLAAGAEVDVNSFMGSPLEVAGPSAMIWPRFTRSPG